jgi:hypothetical protein
MSQPPFPTHSSRNFGPPMLICNNKGFLTNCEVNGLRHLAFLRAPPYQTGARRFINSRYAGHISHDLLFHQRALRQRTSIARIKIQKARVNHLPCSDELICLTQPMVWLFTGRRTPTCHVRQAMLQSPGPAFLLQIRPDCLPPPPACLQGQHSSRQSKWSPTPWQQPPRENPFRAAGSLVEVADLKKCSKPLLSSR